MQKHILVPKARVEPRPLLHAGVAGLLFFLWCASSGAAATLDRGPYLQQITENQATIVWRTTTAVACTLAYGPSGSYDSSVESPSGTEHVVTLTGLTAGMRYDYKVSSEGQELAGGADCFLRTAPQTGSGAGVVFLVWGDSGKGSNAQWDLAAQMNTELVDFALHVGDIVYPDGHDSDYNPRYFEPYAPLVRRTPVWAAPGNHDLVNEQDFKDIWHLPTNPVDGSELFYSFDYGDVHFVVLDTNDAHSYAMREWMETDLQSTQQPWKIVFFHHPVYSCSDYHGSSNYKIDTYGPIFEATGVDLVLYGHDHHFERSYPMQNDQAVNAQMDPDYVDPGAPIYVVTGGGAGPRPVDSNCSHTAVALSESHYSMISIEGGLLTLEAIGPSGQMFDRMTVSKSVGPIPESVDLLAPSGAEELAIGDTLDILWSSTSGVGALHVELSRTSASGPWETLFDPTPNDGSETWNVTGPASQTCWMRIGESQDGDPSSQTAFSFQIVEPDTVGEPSPIGFARINFQPEGAPIPTDYEVDSGQPFETNRGYGWTDDVFVQERSVLPGDPRDTFVDVINNVTEVWELAVENGSYFVSLTCGDPVTSATHRVALEGQLVVQDLYTIGGQYIETSDLFVSVTDGRLTMTVGGSGKITHTKVNRIEVAGAGLTLLEPAGGEAYCLGSTQTIRWADTSPQGEVLVELSRTGSEGPWETILASTPNDGEETWVPDGDPSSQCYLRLTDQASAATSTSSSPFGLTTPDLQLLQPNGGESWVVDSVQDFVWTSSCLDESLRIEVSRDGSNGPWSVLLQATANDGVESWTVQSENVGWTHARIVAPSGPVDASDAPFEVVEGIALTLQSPNGGEILRIGENHEIQWIAFGIEELVLELETGENTWENIASGVDASAGGMTWLVPDQNGTGYRIRAFSVADTSIVDTSDATFTIAPPVPPQPIWRISFQPEGTTAPTEYTIDPGLPYTVERGHGWDGTMWMQKRDMLTDDCRDGFVQVVNEETATWNLDVPSGSYRVTLTCGDPQTSGTHRVALEGVVVVDDVYAIGGEYVTEVASPVTVADGQLTMTVGGNGQITSTKVACIEVESLDSSTDARPQPQLSAPIHSPRLRIATAPVVRGPVQFAIELPQTSTVRLNVYDVAGRQIAVLQNGVLAAGEHRRSWTPRDRYGSKLASGVYFLHFETAGFEQRQKLVILR